jgi:hypothetical protein
MTPRNLQISTNQEYGRIEKTIQSKTSDPFGLNNHTLGLNEPDPFGFLNHTLDPCEFKKQSTAKRLNPNPPSL